MRKNTTPYRWPFATAAVLYALTLAPNASAHGLVSQPASRGWICGATTKPEHFMGGGNATPVYPECGAAFNGVDQQAPYNFMAILSHSRGAYEGLSKGDFSNLPKNVCSYDSKSFGGKTTVWDKLIDWPAAPIKAGTQEFTWDISWGPHFDDTEHFRYWITKPDYKFEVGKPVSWSDFESTPFCDLEYFDAGPNNPAIIPDKANSKFRTTCNVPARTGHHIIYSEWGRLGTGARKGGTDERFHSCVDVSFDGSVITPPKAVISPKIDDTVYGAGTIQLHGGQSSGDQLSYRWSIDASNPALYKLNNSTSAAATLTMQAPPAGTASTFTVTLSVTDKNKQINSASAVIKHLPVSSDYVWRDLGVLRGEVMKSGDVLRLRTMDKQGSSQYYPKDGLKLTAETARSDMWAYALGTAVNAIKGDVAIGVLSAGSDEPKPVKDVDANKIYVRNIAIQNVYLEVQRQSEPPNGGCSVTLQSGAGPWWAGLQVATKYAQTVLDFGANLDLSKVQVQTNDFGATVEGNKLILTKKSSWINEKSAAYVGLHGNNIPALATLKAPACGEK